MIPPDAGHGLLREGEGVAARVLGPGADAEDVSQNVFLKVYENLATYRPSYRFFSWIYRITMNAALSHRKRGRRTEPALIPDLPDEMRALLGPPDAQP